MASGRDEIRPNRTQEVAGSSASGLAIANGDFAAAADLLAAADLRTDESYARIFWPPACG